MNQIFSGNNPPFKIGNRATNGQWMSESLSYDEAMTMIRGARIIEAPCCGKRYSSPNYLSMNFMAWEFWTDGWRRGSLMPNDEGLRHCDCGRYLLLNEMKYIETVETTDLHSIGHVPDEKLPECIGSATNEDVEIAARLEYWRALNHDYRERYRQHRDAEETATQAKWESQNPDRRTWWQKFRGHKAPVYKRPPDSPYTYPEFVPTDEQMRNMKRLNSLLMDRSARGEGMYTFQLAELHREMGHPYIHAVEALLLSDPESKFASETTYDLILKLAKEGVTAPMRYRM